MVMTKKFVKYWFPFAVHEIEEDVHKFYRSMGLEYEFVVPKMELSEGYLKEGEIPREREMKIIARPKIGVLKDVEVW